MSIDENPIEQNLDTKKKRITNRRRKIVKRLSHKNKTSVSDINESSDIIAKIRDYLLSYEGKSNWKFNKVTQKALLQNMYFKDKCDSSLFKIVKKYIQALQGASKTRVLEKCNSIINDDCSGKTSKNRASKIASILNSTLQNS